VNIDELARSAATEARTVAAESIDPAAMLGRLYRTRRNRSVASIVAIVIVAVAVAIGAVAARMGSGNDSAPAVSTQARPCAHATCHHVVLTVPVTFTLPDTFQNGFEQQSLDVIEVYRGDVATTGVSVAENAIPVKDDYSWARDPAAGTTAKSVAMWLSKRPFLRRTAVVPTQVGGLPAWRVSGQLKPGARLPAHKSLQPVAPTFIDGGGGQMAYSPSLIGEYTLVDVPGAGITVIWSWSVNHGPKALVGNQAFIDTLAFH
jgi:hypothetical protein